MQETRTAGLAADRLRAAGYEVTTGVGKTGVVGLLRNGDGPTVMLRADMDALPVEEATGLPYASKVTATRSRGQDRARRRTCAATTCMSRGSRAPQIARRGTHDMARHTDGGLPTRRRDRAKVRRP